MKSFQIAGMAALLLAFGGSRAIAQNTNPAWQGSEPPQPWVQRQSNHNSAVQTPATGAAWSLGDTAPSTPAPAPYQLQPHSPVPAVSPPNVIQPGSPIRAGGCDASGSCDSSGYLNRGGCDSSGCGTGGCDGSGCGLGGNCFNGCGQRDFRLGNLLGLDPCSRWAIGGFTQAGFHDNNVPFSQTYNDLLSFQDVPESVHLNQQWFYAERRAGGQFGPGIGGRIDVIYGTDAQKTQAIGNPNARFRNQGTFDAAWDHGEYGWAIPQLYGELCGQNGSLKIGKWFTPAGFERVPSVQNFFYSRSYSFFNSQAFTHTGVLGSYNGLPCTTVYAGWGLGWDTGFDQLNSGNCFIGGFSRQLSSKATLSLINTIGNFGWRDGGSAGDISRAHQLTLTLNPTCALQYALQADFLRTDNPGISTFDTFGLNNYLFYRLTDRIRTGGRVEWWKADGFSFYEVSGGLNVSIARNLVIRPELRQDWSPGIGLDESSFGIDAILSY
jgi:Putative beta-barrel porin-2, OmpL-like. bbp2